MKRKDVVVRAPHLGCLCLYNAPHPAQPWVERDISGAINDVGRLRHTSHLCWYLVHAPFTCSHTYNLFSLLNFADLSCDCEEFSAVKGLRSARWIWSHDSDWLAGWLSLCLSNGIFTSLFLGRQYFHPTIQLHKKIKFAGFRFSYIISQCGNVAGLVSLMCLLYE